MGWLQGKVALITGGAHGIGRSVALRFIAEGAGVVVLDLDGDELARLQQQHGASLVGVPGDVRRYEDHERAAAVALQQFGKIDVLIANAAIHDGFIPMTALPPSALGQGYSELFDVNVKGCLLAVKAALPALQQSSGNIIFTLSGSSFFPDGGGVLYTASKHAVLGLLRQLAFELAPNIRVNGVAPGGTISNLASAPSLRAYTKERPFGMDRSEAIKRRNPMGLVMDGDDHVAAYVLLASDQAAAITGEVIRSDGGLSIRGCWQGESPLRNWIEARASDD